MLEDYYNSLIRWANSIPIEPVQRTVPTTAREIIQNENVACSISGGSDSDIMLDIVTRADFYNKVRYYTINTGLEMQATKKHIKELEEKYGVKIEIVDPDLKVAAAVREVGYPFLSKQISEYIDRLQGHGFKWENESFAILDKRYPGCQAALRWWCNDWGEDSSFNISRNPFLKEFMMQNPPDFHISCKCCDCSKKGPADKFRKENDIDLTMIGIRKAEGGVRSSAYKSCMNDGTHGLQHFPIFWFTDADKRKYEKLLKIERSDAYKVYGCKRTGCAGCPFGSGFEDELEMLKRFEPALYRGVSNIFAPSYAYTRAYRAFKQTEREKITGHQTSLFEMEVNQ